MQKRDRCGVNANGSSPLENMRGLEHYLNDIMSPHSNTTDMKAFTKEKRPSMRKMLKARKISFPQVLLKIASFGAGPEVSGRAHFPSFVKVGVCRLYENKRNNWERLETRKTRSEIGTWGVFGADEHDSGIIITRRCKGVALWGCASGELGEKWQRA
ncbi:unnamed protein product [Psylliodes chrysocephalus]|uniref:Uncharacterized protein n=1 Tax=Psylliodes chrysocephalus TaxID=3402493 RepID=A0A9P0CJ21_9CUCU|nr:unnamed protein product [Psylliodes chrysocephala]